ncbi:hypothetical protein H8E77_15860 [bacterium]|nr:hypothetical protein [bacterium]
MATSTELDVLEVFRMAKEQKESLRIGDYMGFSQNYINVILRSLVVQGYLERTEENQLQLTNKGWETLEKSRPKKEETEDDGSRTFQGGQYHVMEIRY